MIYLTPDVQGNMSRSGQGFKFKAKFKEEDSGFNPDDDLGTQEKSISVDDISTNPQDFNLQFNRDGFDITVKSKVRKIPLSELGIDLSNNVNF